MALWARIGLGIALFVGMMGCSRQASVAGNFSPGVYLSSARLVAADSGGLSLNAIEFGSNNSDATKTITLSNSGTSQATSLQISLSGSRFRFLGGVFPGTGGTCGTTLAGGRQCTIVLEYAVRRGHTSRGNLTIRYQRMGGSETATLPITGSSPLAAPLTFPTLLGRQTLSAAGLTVSPNNSRVNDVVVETIGGSTYAFVSSSMTWLTSGNAVDGMRIFDVTNPAAPTYLRKFTVGATPAGMVVKDGYLYIPCLNSDRLYIVDVRDPSNPGTPVYIATGNGPFSADVKDGYAYVANSLDNTVSVFDVRTPLSPTLVTTLTSELYPFRLMVRGDYLYVVNHGNPEPNAADRSSYLTIYDIRNPSSISRVKTMKTSENFNAARKLSFSGNRLVIGHWGWGTTQGDHSWSYGATAGFSIYDVASPQSPAFLGEYQVGSSYEAFAIGNYVITHGVYGTQRLWDATDPTAVTLVEDISGTNHIGTGEGNIFQYGNRLYITGNNSGLSVFDVSTLVDLATED